MVNLHKKRQTKTLNMAKTISKPANSLTKNVFSNKIITDTKKSENAKNERKPGDKNWKKND